MWVGYYKFFSGVGYKYNSSRKRLLAATLFAPFLLVGEDDGAEPWMGPAVILTHLIPYFFASWYTESLVADKLLQRFGMSAVPVEHGLLVANLVSYGMIAFVVAMSLIVELWGITWDDLRGVKRKFQNKFSENRTGTGKRSLPWTSKTNESVRWE
jgi:hypothetical protein